MQTRNARPVAQSATSIVALFAGSLTGLASAQVTSGQTSGPVTSGPVQSETAARELPADGIPRRTVQRDAKRVLDMLPSISQRDAAALLGGGAAQFPFEFRTIDGTYNNLANPTWGAAGVEMIRMLPPVYADGVNAPARPNGPSARAVSNAMHAQFGEMPNNRNISDYLWQWGQFLDHDIDETPGGSGDTFDIAVPAGDAWFDPNSDGDKVIGLERSAAASPGVGVREQLNNITAYIDASNVYGSEEERAHFIRANDNSGRLKVSEGNLLPYNTENLDNAMTTSEEHFLAGDVRANEQVALIAIHTLFVREHNHWADQIRADFPQLDGDAIYERARAIVAAEMQAITYNEFLPLLVGENALPPYNGYNPTMNPGIANVFATAGFRVGHTMLSSTLPRRYGNGMPDEHGDMLLQAGFFVPDHVGEHGVDGLLAGLAQEKAQIIDQFVIDDVRNLLFGPPGSGGFDLASLNIQRGRDHGLPSYNRYRMAAGRPPAMNFDQVAGPQTAAALASVYSSPEEIDPWTGFLAEPRVPGALVGPTLRSIIVDQFVRLRDGDRFWYEAYLPQDLVDLVNEQTLATIIQRNTGTGVGDSAFEYFEPCLVDLNADGATNLIDIQDFLIGFTQGSSIADLDQSGTRDLEDVQLFLIGFGEGCP